MQVVSTIRVRYQETDQMGVVYHGNYFTWLEIARTDLIKELGVSYAQFEALGVYLPVTEAQCKYLMPAKYDDLIMVKTWVQHVSPIRITFWYEVYKEDQQKNYKLAEGKTEHVFVDCMGKPTRIDKTQSSLWNLIRNLDKKGD